MFIGDKLEYAYFLDSVTPVEEEHSYSNLEWIEAARVTSNYGWFKAELLGFPTPE